jgi:DNA-binding FadR family transcriptional regulator
MKVAETVVRDLIRAMRDLPPQTMLAQEHELMQKFGAGRRSIREALRVLEAHGFVRMVPGPAGGPMTIGTRPDAFARVSSLHLHLAGATYRHIVEARTVVEPIMAGLAAARLDPARVPELADNLDASTSGRAQFVEVVSHFHTLISLMSMNPVLSLYGRALKDLHRERIDEAVFGAEVRRAVIADHVEIAGLIVRRDGDGAEAAMRAHVRRFLGLAPRSEAGILDETVNWT